MIVFHNSRAILTLTAAMVLLPAAHAQFSSGSNGSDGALNYTTAGTYDFDPATLGLNAAGDNVFNFTTINIGAGVTLRLRSSLLRQKSVVWLASGNVTIAGTLDLSGMNAPPMNVPEATIEATRAPAEPGPGGFAGGLGTRLGGAATAGSGPSGGAAGTAASCLGVGGSYGTLVSSGAGVVYGSAQLVPLLGGSGGGGAYSTTAAGGLGGAGGGAIRIVSSTSIAVTGSLLANGGYFSVSADNTCPGGGGAGGGIHLIAPTISGSGTISAAGVTNNVTTSGAGRIHLSAIADTFNGSVTPAPITGGLFAPPLPALVPTVSVVSVGGVAAPVSPTGSYLVPDVTIDTTSPVTIDIAASNVPVGTAIKLVMSSELAADQTITCSALTGTTASSTASCTATFPTGLSRALLRASW